MKKFKKKQATQGPQTIEEMIRYRSGPSRVDPPKPTRTFKPGDLVSVGNLEDEVVLESAHEGRWYLIDYTSVDTNYGRPIRREHQRIVWPWYEVFPRGAREGGTKFTEEAWWSRVYFSNRTVEHLLGSVLRWGMNLDPVYQRGYVWTSKDREFLLDAIFAGRRIGDFVVRKLPYTSNGPSYEIVDGKQRVSALVDFYLSRYPYHGLFYHELSSTDRYTVVNHGVQVAELSESTTDEQAMEFFLAVNDTGRRVDPEHLDRVRKLLAERTKR